MEVAKANARLRDNNQNSRKATKPTTTPLITVDTPHHGPDRRSVRGRRALSALFRSEAKSMAFPQPAARGQVLGWCPAKCRIVAALWREFLTTVPRVAPGLCCPLTASTDAPAAGARNQLDIKSYLKLLNPYATSGAMTGGRPTWRRGGAPHPRATRVCARTPVLRAGPRALSACKG